MSSLTLVVVAIFAGLGVLGFLYAYIIYLKPWDRTWLEVVAGVGFTILGEMTLIAVTLYYFGYLSELWPMVFIPPACYVTTGVSQIYWQERKKREGYKRSKVKLVEHSNGNEVQEE